MHIVFHNHRVATNARGIQRQHTQFGEQRSNQFDHRHLKSRRLLRALNSGAREQSAGKLVLMT